MQRQYILGGEELKLIKEESFIFYIKGRQKWQGGRRQSFWMNMAAAWCRLFSMYLRTVITGCKRDFSGSAEKMKDSFASQNYMK